MSMAIAQPRSTDGRLDKLEAKLDRLDSKFDEFIDFVTKQFHKVEQRFEQIDGRFERADSRLERLENGQDHILGELQAFSQESIVAAHRTQRIEHWVIKASKKINIPYHP